MEMIDLTVSLTIIFVVFMKFNNTVEQFEKKYGHRFLIQTGLRCKLEKHLNKNQIF